MLTFHSYEHFTKYCFKIAHNKEIKLTKKQYEAFQEFEVVKGFLDYLKQNKVINYKDCVLNKIVNLFKNNKIEEATTVMAYFSKKISNFKKGEIDIYYVFTSFQSMFNFQVEFNEEFILNHDKESVFFPSKLRILEIIEETEKVYSISVDKLGEKGIFGIYFIYDDEGVLAYIGKSSSCAVNRSFTSASERKLLDFSKIEIRKPKTKSDIAIYEAYYISKYKPYCNNDLIYPDETTLLLPELEVTKTFERNSSTDYYEFNYTFYQSKVYDSAIVIDNLGKSMFLDNNENKLFLENKGILDKYSMKQKAYEVSLSKLKENGYLNVAELKFELMK